MKPRKTTPATSPLGQEVIGEILQQMRLDVPSKVERTRLAIAAAAIEEYAEHGVDGLLYENVAKRAGVSRPLLYAHFKVRDDLFMLSARLVRADIQAKLRQRLSTAHSMQDALDQYVESVIYWPIEQRAYGRFWMHFLTECLSNTKVRELNDELTEIGIERVREILLRDPKLSKRRPEDLRARAEEIQMLVFGAGISVMTDVCHKKPKEMVKQLQAAILQLLQ